jgi:aspartate aminotransferase
MGTPNLSDRIEAVEASKSVELASVIAELRRKGERVIGFNVGEPDFPTPEVVIKATQKALEAGHTRYALVPGEPFLREAIAKKLKEDQNINIGIENICVSNGSKQVLYSLFQLICNPGDEILVPCPYWVSFPEAIKLAGGKPVFIPSEDGDLDFEKLKSLKTDKTKAIILNSPNNPSGLVYSKELKEKVVKYCKENNLYLISDEAYETLIYNDQKFVGPGGIADPKLENTLIVQSFSKSYCMTGFRLGYVAGPAHFIKGMNKLQSHVCGNTPVFIQKGAEAALNNADAISAHMKEVFSKRSEIAYELCKEIFPQTPKPQGAFYLFPKIQEELLERFGSDEKLAMHILNEAKVALLPGSFFGMPGFLRICFSTSEDEIRAGLKAIKECL